MRNIVSNNGVDLILELLRQSKLTETRAEKKENNIIQSDITEYNASPRTSLRSSDVDGSLMLSIKDNGISLRKNDENYIKIKNYIKDILNRMTDKDYKQLLEMGYKPEDLTVESLVELLQTLKGYDEIQYSHNYSEGKSKKDSEENRKDISDGEIAERMEYFNLPVTEESIEQIRTVLKISEVIPSIEKKDIMYLLRNDLPFTIENLYKAKYSRQKQDSIKKLSDDDWKELMPQVRDIIGKTGLPAEEDILDDARWLIENDLPLTKDNLEIMADVDLFTDTYDKDAILNKILYGMREGVRPEDVVLWGNNDPANQEFYYDNENISEPDFEKIERLMENINEDYDDEIVKAVKNGRDITLENLKELKADKTESEDASSEELSKDQMARVIAAKRQLEEIRLKMTAEAALRLEKKGFNIDTRPLQEVVEKLRSEEENYYRQLYKLEGVTPDEAQIDALRTTVRSMHELSTVPAYVLGTTLYEDRQTVSDLLDAGNRMLAELEKAKEAYEPLLTQPRKDFGDSIQKAFANMESLMEEMGIEDTIYNRRAIKILGYNNMEITKESIEQVKAYDLKVNYLLQNFNPAIAVQLIKEGINPMDVPIDDLNSVIDKLNSEGYTSLEKYSTYLYKLEKESGITESEKKAYIGIYRLLYQIDKSDGAALGAVIKSGREVTLNHLLTALRTNRKGAVDYSVDEDFGLLNDLSFEEETITDQLETVFNGNTVREEIQKSVVKQLLSNMTPEKLYQLHNKVREDSGLLSEGEVWETIGNMSVEKLLDQLTDMEDNGGRDNGLYYEKMQELREIYNNCDQAVRFLNDFKLPCTTTNLLMAEYILNNKGTLFKNLKNKLKKTEDLTDTLIDKKTENEAYEELEKEVNKVIEEESKQEDVDSVKLNQLRGMALQMKFIKTLAQREFYHIPLEVSGEITNINLTIIRGKGDGSKVTVTLKSDRLGGIKAEAALKDNKVSGYFACDNNDGLKALQSQAETFETLLKGESLKVKQLNFILQQSPEAYRGLKDMRDFSESGNPETERTLYRIAKSILYFIKSAENADKLSHTEVAEINKI